MTDIALASLMRQEVTVQTPGLTTDAYNNEVRDWSAPVGRSLNVYLEQTEETEVTVARETYESNWLMVAPASDHLKAWERVVYGDLKLEVIGPPRRYFDPELGADHHIEARLRAVTG
jgi:hypothetical protein